MESTLARTTLSSVYVLLLASERVGGVSGRLRGLWVALIAAVPLRPPNTPRITTPGLVQSLISGQREMIQSLGCQDPGTE